MPGTACRTLRNARRAALVALAFCVVLSAASAFASDTSTRTAGDIQARWAQLRPTWGGGTYVSKPSVHAPYATGAITSGFAQDGLNAINYCRYLAGLPDDVTIDPSYSSLAQYGAVLLAASSFSHTPPKPADMDTAFYNLGYKDTSSSNIGWGDTSLANFTFSCMDDCDTENISCLGHRRWILDPPMAKTGLGYADLNSTTYAIDRSRTSAVDYDTVNWPAAGPFPVELVDSYTPWSVTLNPALYTFTSGPAGHTVTLRRVNDGRTWTFTSANTDVNGTYFNFQNSGYGVSNCFIFRPNPSAIGGYHVGDAFDVTVTGGISRKSDGQPTTITYRTEFISENGPASSMRLSGASKTKVKRSYKLSGYVAPAPDGGTVRVTLSHYSHRRWRSAGAKNVTLSDGRFRLSIKPGSRGAWRARARYAGQVSSQSGPSAAIKNFTVK